MQKKGAIYKLGLHCLTPLFKLLMPSRKWVLASALGIVANLLRLESGYAHSGNLLDSESRAWLSVQKFVPLDCRAVGL